MNKTALITGASGGIGLELAKIFAENGFNLVLAARNGSKLAAAKNELEARFGISAEIFAADLSDDGAPNALYSFTKEKELEINVLVNNAGFGSFGRFAESGIERQKEMIRLNVSALTELTHLYLNDMLKQGGGKILNLASTAAFQAGPLMSVYYATKAYVLSLTEALSAELRGSGVSVSALCPGPTRTGFEKAANLSNSGLFKNLKTMSAADVARCGFNGLMKGKTVIIPGMGNKLLIAASKFAPRALTKHIVYAIQRVR